MSPKLGVVAKRNTGFSHPAEGRVSLRNALKEGRTKKPRAEIMFHSDAGKVRMGTGGRFFCFFFCHSSQSDSPEIQFGVLLLLLLLRGVGEKNNVKRSDRSVSHSSFDSGGGGGCGKSFSYGNASI